MIHLLSSGVVASVIDWLIRATWQTACLAAVVWIVQLALSRWLSPRVRYAMWLLVLLRLAIPVQWGVQWSPFPAVASTEPPVPTQTSGLTMRAWVGGMSGDFSSDVTQPEMTPKPAQQIPWRHILLAAWGAASAGFAVRLFVRHWRFARALKSESCEVRDESLQAIFDACLPSGLILRPKLLVTHHIDGPSVFGVFNPCVLLPASMVDELSPAQARFVFLHELAHLRRWDTRAEALGSLICCVHWFNPVAWLVLKRLRVERELACDEAVLRMTSPENRSDYGRVLLAVATRQIVARPAILMATEGTQLKGRINMIAKYRDSRRTRLLAGALLALIGIAVVTDAADQPPRPAEPKLENKPAAVDVTTGEKPEAEAVAKLKTQLETKIPELRFEDVAFSDVIDFLRDTTEANLFVNWKALEAAGIDHNAPVRMRVRNVTFHAALRVLLDSVGGGAVKLRYVAENGIITISTEEDLGRNVETRTYDIRDLLIVIPDLEVGKPATTQPETTRKDLVDQITTLIMETVGVGTWKQDGGQLGNLRELSGQLIITNTPAVHAQVVQLLGKLREQREIQITIESRSIAIDLKKLPEGKLKSTLEARDANRAGTRESQAWFLNQAETVELMNAVKQIQGATLLSAPRITIFNGQNAAVQVSNEVAYVKSFESDSKGKDQPVIGTVSPGVRIDLNGTVSADRKFVTINFHPKITKLLRIDIADVKASDGEPRKVQLPVVENHELQTTISVPDGGTLLLGGMTGTSDAEGAKAEGEQPTIMFLIKPTIIIQREVEQENFPLLSTPSGKP